MNAATLRGALLLIVLLSMVGCAGSSDSRKRENDRAETTLDEYEKEFDPSVFSIPPEKVFDSDTTSNDSDSPKLLTTDSMATGPGYRVQVGFTNEIDRANSLRDSLASSLPDERTYVVYDAPYYKIRIGNFQDRVDAGRMVKTLVDMGFKEAWVVPDQILRKFNRRKTDPSETNDK